VAYLADDGAIVLVDAAAGKILQRLIPKTPASALKLDGSQEAPRLTFKRFVRERGTHRDHYIDLDSLGLISCRISEAVRSGEEGAVRPAIGGQRPRPATGTLARDPKTTIGFGDSITYGFLYKQPYPEFGYIPRLLTKLQEEIYEDANLINEGVGGTKTYEAIQRIDEVILTHGAQNLLFHYGTNDILHVNEVTTAEVVDNIAYMIDRVLDFGMTPVLSTLIPRNTIAADGIYLERALDICTGIRELARERGVSLVDFWRLFSHHPEGDGGYWALMSDNVHPSEKGYQLMAESWHQVLLALPPLPPRPAVLSSVTALRTRAIWPANEELDIHYYEVQFGNSPVLMDRQATTVGPTFEFFRFPYQDQARRQLYFRIRAVDQSGGVSSWAPTQRVSFTTAAVWGEKTGKQ
jgi:lysophospholipase L1-like esterase